VGDIDLSFLRSYRDYHKWEDDLKKTVVEPIINNKDWPQTLENIREFLMSISGAT
jgi:hypothetical protein